ncbi:MAG: GNAT family N-acetyltransferase [Parvularculaceae bacterium]|nr:GNAT family N-acetyltransferase [Parvularculaceae bacterium]
MTSPTPTLETERLILRGRTIADFPAYAAIWAAPETQRYTTRAPVPTEEAWMKFMRMEGLWSLTGCGWWLVVEKTSGAVIGEVGVADFKRQIVPSLDGMPEFGWMLAPASHGRCYAKEAVGAALRWSERKFRDATFCCLIDDENTPSIRVAEAHGFHRAAIGRYKGTDVPIYLRTPRN